MFNSWLISLLWLGLNLNLWNHDSRCWSWRFSRHGTGNKTNNSLNNLSLQNTDLSSNLNLRAHDMLHDKTCEMKMMCESLRIHSEFLIFFPDPESVILECARTILAWTAWWSWMVTRTPKRSGLELEAAWLRSKKARQKTRALNRHFLRRLEWAWRQIQRTASRQFLSVCFWVCGDVPHFFRAMGNGNWQATIVLGIRAQFPSGHIGYRFHWTKWRIIHHGT